MEKLTIGIIALSILLSCNSDTKKETYFKQDLDLTIDQQYEGLLPCADCEGIKTTITFKDNKKYHRSSIYVGKSTETFEDSGSYTFTVDSVIKTITDGKTTNCYKWMGDELLQLDANCKKTEGALAPMYLLTATTAGANLAAANSNIVYSASGHQPDFTLAIYKDQTFSIKGLSEKPLVFALPGNTINHHAKTITYIGENAGNRFIINIKKQSFNDPTCGINHPTTLELILNNKTYTCGGDKYALLDQIEDVDNSKAAPKQQLTGIWQLYQLRGREVASTYTAANRPYIHFVDEATQYRCFTGCTNLEGSYTKNNDIVKFKIVEASEANCDDQQFINDLLSTTKIIKTSNKVVLKDGFKELMTFTKK